MDWSGRAGACGSFDADVPGAFAGGEKNADGWVRLRYHVTWDWGMYLLPMTGRRPSVVVARVARKRHVLHGREL